MTYQDDLQLKLKIQRKKKINPEEEKEDGNEEIPS